MMKAKLTKAITHRDFLKMCGLAVLGAGAGQVVVPPMPAAAQDGSYDNMTLTGWLKIGDNQGGNTKRLYLAGADANHYIYSTGFAGNNMYFGEWGGVFHFVDTSTGADVMTVISGRLGLGSTSPGEKLHVEAGNIRVYQSNAPAVSYVIGQRLGDDNGTFPGVVALAWHKTTGAVSNSFYGKLGRITFGGNHSDGSFSNILYAAAIEGIAEGTFNNSAAMPTAIAFFTGSSGSAANVVNTNIGTERMRIASGGNVGIGTSTPTEKLEVAGNLRANGQVLVNGVVAIKSDGIAAQSYYA